MSGYLQRLALTLCLSFNLLGLACDTPTANGAETEVEHAVELTEAQKKSIDDLIGMALAKPRQDAPRSLAAIQKIGPGALVYASRETAKLLSLPLEVNSEAGFDFLLMQVLKNLRYSELLNESAIKALKEIAASENKNHADFAKEVLLIQQWLAK